ncbi:proteasome assembly chaperone family protein [Kineococcus sp. SYSU DK002]|uniref:proteasome assembly chaperone family protein n=1 Tax=Kineococcus sp. SYSU DK002 TaxID=3383123 RepID=UPI003D7D8DEA
MLDPASLYSYEGERPSLVEPPLVIALSGFIDAGNAVRQTVEHLLRTCRNDVVASFDVDQLHDYRARRPTMTFGGQDWVDYEPPRLQVHRVTDEDGSSLLLLSGPEPDVQWERFSAAVWRLVDELGVGLVTVLSAAPTAVPHTRPAGVTASATRPELLDGFRTWDLEAQVPAHASALVHLRGGQAGRDVVSVLAHVPHYLAGSDYPDAAAVLVRTLSGTTGVAVPVQSLQEAASATRVEVDRQVAESPEAAAVVTALEEQYDASGDEGRGTGAASAFLPTADELGEEFERFLAKREEDPGPE